MAAVHVSGTCPSCNDRLTILVMTSDNSLVHSFNNHVGIESNLQDSLDEFIIMQSTSSFKRGGKASNLTSGKRYSTNGETTAILSMSSPIRSIFRQKYLPNSSASWRAYRVRIQRTGLTVAPTTRHCSPPNVPPTVAVSLLNILVPRLTK